MGIFDRWFGKGQDESGHTPGSMPWDQRPSIYEHVQAHIDPARPGLPESGLTLLDEERIAAGSQIRWAAGAWDGVLTHHMGEGDEQAAVAKIAGLVGAYCQQPTAANKEAVY